MRLPGDRVMCKYSNNIAMMFFGLGVRGYGLGMRAHRAFGSRFRV